MTDTSTVTVKPCPFCGGEAFVNFDELGDTNLAHVMCSECWSTGPERDDGTEQLAWNTRAPQTPAQAARVLLPIFEKRHISWAQSKARNPEDYTSQHSATADALRAIAGGE